MNMNSFFEPLKGEFKWNPHGIINLIGALGIIPATYIGRYADSIWASLGFIVLCYAIVWLLYLTYCYFKTE